MDDERLWHLQDVLHESFPMETLCLIRSFCSFECVLVVDVFLARQECFQGSRSLQDGADTLALMALLLQCHVDKYIRALVDM